MHGCKRLCRSFGAAVLQQHDLSGRLPEYMCIYIYTYTHGCKRLCRSFGAAVLRQHDLTEARSEW